MTEQGPLSFHDDDDERRAAQARLEGHGVPPPRPPQRRPRYGWIVGVAFLVWLVYITLNTLRTDEPGSRGVPDHAPLPAFAAPLALSDLEGDANIASRPGQGAAGERPACAVRGRRIVNSCQLAERGPVVLAFYASRAGKACPRQLDALERARRDFPGVQFVAVAIRGDRGDLRRTIRRRGWRFPVAYDRDGQVANLYRVAGCPTTTLAYPGGIVMRSYLGTLADRRLRTALERLVAGSRQRGWTPPRTTRR